MPIHDQPHPGTGITVLDLPADILYNIFDYFQDNRRYSKEGRYDNEGAENRQIIQNTRLVCHRFHKLVSSRLCPILQVRLDQASLDLITDISKTPLVASGVRDVQVVLDYRPRELAQDLVRFKNLRKSELDRVCKSCAFLGETWDTGDDDGDNDTVCLTPPSEYKKAMHYYQSICSAWDDYFSSADRNYKDAVSLQYQRILHQGHADYRLKHEEQHRIITDGSFITTLASSISRMSSFRSLHFITKIGHYIEPYILDPTHLLNNEEELNQFMSTPQDWQTIGELEGKAELSAAKILSELPIAIYKAGTLMREININCSPPPHSYSMICPNRPNQFPPSWPDLTAACQHLQKIRFSETSYDTGCHPLLSEEQAVIALYLGAILSSKSIKDVSLEFSAFHSSNRSYSSAKASYHIGSVLSATKWPRIKRVCIRHVSLTQDELETFFFSALGDSLESVYLDGIELLSGSWAGALDILREKVVSGCLDGKRTVGFLSLTGGQFGEEERRETSGFFSYDGDVKEPMIVRLAQNYVLGELAENPLREGSRKA
ncbi:hypothetical protein V495_04308 [Pseudogymnoascus sp. VKM F-4514 (FW-929)]|nr:hypothetical protein V495_04308 [Pseudogymnoascus sp. VKM F-4514 (FW-929)]KFY55982.1 hypothetical protein V497_06596 [Pseudogymnoascus sp. VKM F-4516 (FW-969)]